MVGGYIDDMFLVLLWFSRFVQYTRRRLLESTLARKCESLAVNALLGYGDEFDMVCFNKY